MGFSFLYITLFTLCVSCFVRFENGVLCATCDYYGNVDVVNGIRSQKYPNGVTGATATTCCQLCEPEITCTYWVLDVTNSICYIIQHADGTQTGANRQTGHKDFSSSVSPFSSSDSPYSSSASFPASSSLPPPLFSSSSASLSPQSSSTVPYYSSSLFPFNSSSSLSPPPTPPPTPPAPSAVVTSVFVPLPLSVQLNNPERGVYMMRIYDVAASWPTMTMSDIVNFITKYNTQVPLSLVLMLFVLDCDLCRVADIDQTTLTLINNEFNVVRQLNLKAIVRFTYVNPSVQTPSKPYGDAPNKDVVGRHIVQLSSLLAANMDIIFTVQAGFVGVWGEWYYSDNYGDQCGFDTCSSVDNAARSSFIELLLGATSFPDSLNGLNVNNPWSSVSFHSLLPSSLPVTMVDGTSVNMSMSLSRPVQLRTPLWKQGLVQATPATMNERANGLNSTRVGHHNDCFLSSANDQGTYSDYSRQFPYLVHDSMIVPVIVEPCQSNLPRSGCASALNELAQLHVVSIHREYNLDVWSDWESENCIDQIINSVGYRIELTQFSSTLSTVVGGLFSFSLSLLNIGFSPFTLPHLTQIILRHVFDGTACMVTLPVDVRMWLPVNTSDTSGSQSYLYNLTYTAALPSTMMPGRYEVLFQIADPASSLYGVSSYKVSVANAYLNEDGTGFVKLNTILDVLSPNNSSIISGNNITDVDILSVICYPSTNSSSPFYDSFPSVNSTIFSLPPDSSISSSSSPLCPGGYYALNGVCTLCPLGYHCTLYSQPSQCEFGSYATGGAMLCTNCPSTGFCSYNALPNPDNGWTTTFCQRSTGACLCAHSANVSGWDCSVQVQTTPSDPIFESRHDDNTNWISDHAAIFAGIIVAIAVVLFLLLYKARTKIIHFFSTLATSLSSLLSSSLSSSSSSSPSLSVSRRQHSKGESTPMLPDFNYYEQYQQRIANERGGGGGGGDSRHADDVNDANDDDDDDDSSVGVGRGRIISPASKSKPESLPAHSNKYGSSYGSGSSLENSLSQILTHSHSQSGAGSGSGSGSRRHHSKHTNIDQSFDLIEREPTPTRTGSMKNATIVKTGSQF